MSGNTTTQDDVPKSYRDYEGEKVSKGDLNEGDEIALRVSWHTNDFDEALARPTKYTVTEASDTIDDVKLEGEDGLTYTLWESRPEVRCLDDGKPGTDRGRLSARIKRL